MSLTFSGVSSLSVDDVWRGFLEGVATWGELSTWTMADLRLEVVEEGVVVVVEGLARERRCF